jgi:transketolase
MSDAATRDGYGSGLLKIGSNKNVVVLDAGVSDSTRTGKFGEKYPDRFFNMGISEGDMICTAAGLAKSGKVAFATSFTPFLLGRTQDQILVSVCYSDSNVKICGSHNGLSVGEDGPTAQSPNDIAMMRAMPNMSVLCPADAVEAEQMVEFLAEHKGPAYIRLGRPAVKTIHDKDYRFAFGKGDVVRKGKDAAIIATGTMVQMALEAAELLKTKGIDVTVVNMSTIKPLDEKAVVEAARTGVVVSAEDHNVIGGLGDAVAEVIAERKLAVGFERIGIQDRFAESGSMEALYAKYGLDAASVAKAVSTLVSKKKG